MIKISKKSTSFSTCCTLGATGCASVFGYNIFYRHLF